jgi:hypothetical protein
MVGFMVYDVLVGAEGVDIIETMTRIKAHGEGKLVRFHGDFTSENSDDMYTMSKSLRDMGYGLSVAVDGKHFFPWFTWINYLVVETSKVWAGFDVMEFRWSNPAVEPHMPSNANKASLFIDGKPEDMLMFITKHKSDNPWRMLMRCKIVEEVLHGTVTV